MLVAFLAAFAAVAAPAAHSHPPRKLSDADLVRYAARPFDAGRMMLKREVVGVHRGTLVVADYPCGDVCPQYTRRIIHYDVPVAGCARAHGVVVEELVPRIAVMRQSFCEPTPIARKHARR